MINTIFPFIYISVIIVIVLFIVIFITTYICYRLTFYVKSKDKIYKDEFPLPDFEEYKPFHNELLKGMKLAKSLNGKEHYIESFDGLKLYGKYYECKEGNPIELMIHGYRGSAYRDLSNGIERAFALGHNVLLIDQRASHHSQGNTITFGINERYDCLRWIDYIINHINKDAKIILTGVSMGAATVMMASCMELPSNVVGVLADCGYTSPKEIIMKCTKDMKLPPKVFYPFIKLSAKIFGHFNLEESAPIEAVKKTKLPIIFYHGANDNFVPTEMCYRLYDACQSRKKLVIIENCGHGLAYLVDKEKYIKELKEFYYENKE